MSQYTSYWLYQKYEKRGDQDWLPCYPNVLSVDADGTRQRVVKEENDTGCGYAPEPDAEYRWIQVPISEDYICDYCPIYRWHEAPVTDYYCSGTTKWTKEYFQVSLDNGVTWNNVVPEQTRKGNTIIEEESMDCGYVPPAQYEWRRITPVSGDSSTFICDTCYVPPIPTGGTKFSATYTGGTTYSAACDGNTTLTSGNTRPSGYVASAMTTAEIGDCVTSIGNRAFWNYYSLTSVTIPNTVTSIGALAFMNSSNLLSANIPDSVTSIGNYAFSGCTSLTSITIPSGVTSIDSFSFVGCTGLITCTIDCGYIDGYAFSGCTSLTSVTIGSNVTWIDTGVFRYCTSLTSIGPIDSGASVKISSGVTGIGADAFEYCTSLTSVTIPNTVTTIGSGTFAHCTGMTSLTIGSGVTNIGDQAFINCSSLTSITVNTTTPPSLGYYVFDDTNNCPIYVPCDSVNAYKSASRWRDYSSRIQGIPPCGEPTPTFDGKFRATYTGGTTYSAACDSSTELTSDDTEPSGYAHYRMVTAEIGDCVTSIGEYAFVECDNLSNISIPDTVTSIGEHAFGACYSLESITIPSGVTSIGDYAFEVCSALASVTIKAVTPPTIGSNVFSDTPIESGTGYIYVPAESVNAYKAANGWSTYANQIQPII